MAAAKTAAPTGVKISQKEFYQKVMDATGHDRKTVEAVLNVAQDTIEEELRRGNGVKLAIGQFKRADRKAREARNPQTGKPVKVAAKRAAKFVPAKQLKDALN